MPKTYHGSKIKGIEVAGCLGEILRGDRLFVLISANFYFRYASAEVGLKGDPFSNVAVVAVKPAEKGETGREQLRDPLSKIIYSYPHR